MYGRMLERYKHALVIFGVMMVMMIGTAVRLIFYDTLKPNPLGLTSHPVAQTYTIPSATAPGGKQTVTLPAVAGLPVDQHLGNLEGKENALRDVRWQQAYVCRVDRGCDRRGDQLRTR